MGTPPIVHLRDVSKTYQRGKELVPVLSGVNLTVPQGAFMAFMGPSGSGKSTLLNLIAGLDKPSSGTVHVAGSELSQMTESQLTTFRGRTIGFVFQSYQLLPALNALQNVQLPLAHLGLSSAERKRRAETALAIVGLEKRTRHYPHELSGGQEQRVAIARAFVHDPKIIVADEPTGDLDRASADEILVLLTKLSKEFGKTILMVTHDPVAAAKATVTTRLEKGALK